jgi:zinc protease
MNEPMQYEGYTHVETLDGISEYTLDANRLRVLCVPLRMAPVVVFMVTYRVGSRNESMGETGATHFLEHLMFKGSRKFNKAAGTSIFNTLQRKGARVNATTWLDRTNYYALLPDDSLELAVEIEADRMRHALLSREDVESERTVILNELDRGENEPMRKLYQSVWSTAFLAHPYRHPTIGWRSDVEAISPDHLRHFYDTFYWPRNATATIIGAVEPDRALATVRTYFEGISAGPEAIPELTTVEPPQIGERRTTVRMAGDMGAVMAAFKAPAGNDPLLPALSVLSVVLGHGKASRLSRRLVDTGLATGVSSAPSFNRDPGLFYAYVMLTPGTSHEEVETALLATLEELKTEPVDDVTLLRAKAQVYAETAFDRDGPFSMAASLNEAIATGDWRLYVRLPEAIRSVTADDVLEAARRIIDRDRMTIGYFIPKEDA